MSEDMNFDFHVHSVYSRDSLLKPEKIIEISRKIGLSGVAVTDHETIKGAIKTLKIVGEKKLNFKVVVGSEIKTNYGDVVGLFLSDEIKKTDFFEVIDEIREQNGIVVLPHPYKRNTDPNELIKYVDFIEVLNARISKKLNQKARILAKNSKIRSIAGSDAHTWIEIGRVQTILKNCDDNIRECLLKNNIRIKGSELPQPLQLVSISIGKYKKEGTSGLLKTSWRKIANWRKEGETRK